MKNMKKIGVILVGSIVVLAGCNLGDGQKDVLALGDQAIVQARKQVEADNENRLSRAREMEEDLGRRHRFFQAIRGTYEGLLKTDAGDFHIRVTLVPSISPFPVERSRTLEEIATELSGLHLNLHIIQWSGENSRTAVGCRIEGVNPDLVRGQLDIASESCPNMYSIRISANSQDGISEDGDAVATEVLEGRREVVDGLAGQVMPSTSSGIFQFSASRVKR
jgi:hypothetical protein